MGNWRRMAIVKRFKEGEKQGVDDVRYDVRYDNEVHQSTTSPRLINI